MSNGQSFAAFPRDSTRPTGGLAHGALTDAAPGAPSTSVTVQTNQFDGSASALPATFDASRKALSDRCAYLFVMTVFACPSRVPIAAIGAPWSTSRSRTRA